MKKGFTLIEVLVSSLILVIIVAGTFNMYINYIKIQTNIKQRFNANSIIKEIQDNIFGMRRDDTEVFIENIKTITVDNTKYNVTYIKTNYDYKKIEGLSQVTGVFYKIYVSWEGTYNSDKIGSCFITY